MLALALFLLRLGRPPRSPLFPYTTLFRSHSNHGVRFGRHDQRREAIDRLARQERDEVVGRVVESGQPRVAKILTLPLIEDRKSTRLNSSHVEISYAVFCLKKKTRSRQRSRSLC